MIAKTITPRFAPAPPAVLTGRWQLARFTRRDFDILVRQGVIPEDATTELLDGMIVLKDRAARGEPQTTIGNDHRICVERLSSLRSITQNASAATGRYSAVHHREPAEPHG